MMQSDQGPPAQVSQAPDWKIPAIASVRIRKAEYRPRAPRNFKSPLKPVPDALEIVVKLESPMPVRAIPPILYVGSQRLTESEAVDEKGLEIRFWVLDLTKLESDAPIALAWLNDPPPKGESRFKFENPK